MWRLLSRLALLAAVLALGGSMHYNLAEPIDDHRIGLRAIAVVKPGLSTAKRLRFVAGWELQGRDPDFGGLSALLVVRGGLLAVSDKGALIEIGFAHGAPARARIRPLPQGCGQGRIKLQRDTESVARDDHGTIWLGFEWRNAICRTGPALDRASALSVPEQMRFWPHTGGPEAMTRLRDGRIVLLSERSRGDRRETPMLVFDGDPTVPGASARELSYLPPIGYRPTDIAQLPDGDLVILHRRFVVPFDFSTIVAILPAAALESERPIRARAIALFKAPGLHENFEGMAVEEREGRSFLWLVSDDNFAPVQKTYLLKFELTNG